MTFQHRAGVSPYTSSFDLARTCVFGKQSFGHGLCDLQCFQSKFYTLPVPLIPKLRGYFAEFLHHDSLDRLSILYLSTCVGLGYGRLTRRSRRFSRQHRITQSNVETSDPSYLRHMKRGFAYASPYILSLGQPSPRMSYLPASLRSLPNVSLGYRLSRVQSEDVPRPCMLSITQFGMGRVLPVREYQPVVHRLRLSASP